MIRIAAAVVACSFALPLIAEDGAAPAPAPAPAQAATGTAPAATAPAANPAHGAPGHVHGAEEAGPAPATPPTAEEAAALRLQASYLFGMRYAAPQLAEPIKRFELDIAEVMKGVADGLANKESAIEPAKEQEILAKYRAVAEAKIAEAAGKRGDTNAAWLAENAKKPGVTQTASGLQYEVIASGKGATPKSGDKVTCHYVGTLLDGTTFDSSRARGQPATFAVGQLIAGWNEALVTMKEGDHWKLYVPPKLGYGEQGSGQIGPNEILIFDLELIKVGG